MSGTGTASGGAPESFAGEALEGERLDAALARVSGRTRSFIEKRVRDGGAQVDGRVSLKPGLKLKAGQCVEVAIPAVRAANVEPEDVPLTIVYEDAHIAVIDKPAGLVVHPSAGHESGTLVNGLLARLGELSGIGGEARPGIVHRLDKDTSGLMMVAKNDAAHARLCGMLAAREIHKTYATVIQGAFAGSEGRIDAPIGRSPADRKKMAVTPGGKSAVTLWRLRQPLRGASLLDVDIITGRTHQIRVHMASKGHPILGDVIYGSGAKSAPRLMLHARRLEFAHPATGETMAFEAEPPEGFVGCVDRIVQ